MVAGLQLPFPFFFNKKKNQKARSGFFCSFFSPSIFITGMKNIFTSHIKQFKHDYSSISQLCFVKRFIIVRQLQQLKQFFQGKGIFCFSMLEQQIP